MKNTILLMLISLSLISCHRPKPFCNRQCVVDKINKCNKIGQIWINDVDITEEYLSNDSVPKEIVYYFDSKDNWKQFKEDETDAIEFKVKMMRCDTLRPVTVLVPCYLLNNKEIIKVDNPNDPGCKKICITSDGPYYICPSKGHYYPYKGVVLSPEIESISITKIKRNYMLWEYQINGSTVKIKFISN